MLLRRVTEPIGHPSTMPLVGALGFVVVLALVLTTPAVRAQAPAAPAQQPPASPAGAASARELANQVNNPAAPVTLLQFRNILLPAVDGTDGVTNESASSSRRFSRDTSSNREVAESARKPLRSPHSTSPMGSSRDRPVGHGTS